MVAMVPVEQGGAPIIPPELLEVVVVVSAVMRAELPVVGDSTAAVAAAEMVVPQLRTVPQGRRASLLSPILLQLWWLLRSPPTRRSHFRPRSPRSSAILLAPATRQAPVLPMASPTAPSPP